MSIIDNTRFFNQNSTYEPIEIKKTNCKICNFIAISIIILSCVIAVGFYFLLQKIKTFEIAFEYIINNKITPLNINSFNDATRHIPILAYSINNISNILYDDGEQLKKLLEELGKIINNSNLSTR